MTEVIVAKPNMANNPAEMEELVQKALARLTLARAWEAPKLIHELIDEHWEREAQFARIALGNAVHQLDTVMRAKRNPNQLRLELDPKPADVLEMRAA